MGMGWLGGRWGRVSGGNPSAEKLVSRAFDFQIVLGRNNSGWGLG